MDILVDEDASVPFQFLVDGEFVSLSSVDFVVRNNVGTVTTSGTLAFDPPQTECEVDVGAIYNAMDSTGGDFSVRNVTVKFTYNSDVYNLRKSYRILPWLNHVVDASLVRRELGVLDHEFSDEDIDLVVAYYQVRDRVNTDPLVDKLGLALSAGNSKALYANQAIACRAAINLVAALQLRAGVALTDDNLNFERMPKLDYADLTDRLTTRYEAGIEGIDPTVTPTELNTMVASKPVDPVTNT